MNNHTPKSKTKIHANLLEKAPRSQFSYYLADQASPSHPRDTALSLLICMADTYDQPPLALPPNFWRYISRHSSLGPAEERER